MKPSGALRGSLWLAAFALILVGGRNSDPAVSTTGAGLALVAIGISVPPVLRGAVALVALAAALALYAGGARLLIDLLPTLFAGLVCWMFARTLLPGRRALIVRAIAAIDGEDWLGRPAVASYGRRLTIAWAVVQALLAAVGLLAALHARGIWPALPLPSPHQFAGLILPGVVAGTFLLEFFLRPLLLPGVPGHGLFTFLGKLVRSWPQLLE